MSKQNYSNYRKFYTPHHFILLPALSAAISVGVYQGFNAEVENLSWFLFALCCFFILFAVVMMRQHYALGNQDRIVRLEFRLRYLESFGKPSTDAELKLNFSQVAALRFAPDEEFKNLLQKAMDDNISATEIKRSIRNWRADDMRV